MQNSTDARVDGVSGLLLHHFKPQSFEEFRAATEFKQRRQNEMRQRLRQRRGKGEKVRGSSEQRGYTRSRVGGQSGAEGAAEGLRS